MSGQDLLTIGGLLNKKVFVERESKKKGAAYRRIGKVRRFVFHPTEKRVIGIIVKRPDAALMFHRPNLFVAIDRMTVEEEGVVISEAPGSTDRKACQRLGVEWAKCLLWLGMELVTESGHTLGRVGDVTFEAETGRVVAVRRNEGATARLLLGTEEIPVDMIRGFRFGVGSQMADYQAYTMAGDDDTPNGDGDNQPEAENHGAIVVLDAVESLDASGGLAQKAGEATARAAYAGREALAKARAQGAETAAKAKERAVPKVGELGEKAEGALNKGAYATGRQIGRAQKMFSGFVEEYRKARDGEDNGN